MDEKEKRAYRHLLYRAMLDIRLLEYSHFPVLWNLRRVFRQHHRSQQAGALANWLHNLAFYSQIDFRGFEEDSFWKAYERYRHRFPVGGTDYKQAFEDELKRDSAPERNRSGLT